MRILTAVAFTRQLYYIADAYERRHADSRCATYAMLLTQSYAAASRRAAVARKS